DAQYGISSRDDYPQHSARITAGRDLLDGRANIAGSLEWSQTDSLLAYDRPISALGRVTVSNPANTSETDGIPAVREVVDARFWNFNYNGVIYNVPAPSPATLLRIGGAPTQFAADGQSVVAYDPGQILGVPFASGGEGWDF